VNPYFPKALNASFSMVKPGMFYSSTKSQNYVPDSKGIGENDSATHKKSCFPVLQDRRATPFCDQNYFSLPLQGFPDDNNRKNNRNMSVINNM
jgi:hypothetical protein